MGIFVQGRPAYAQNTTADVVGTVTDSTGAVIPNATVTITNVGTQEIRKSVTDGQGQFTFSLLQIGDYKVRVQGTGFKSLELPKFTLTVGERRRVDAVMTVGAQTETVEVTTEPPALQSDSTTLENTLEPEAVQDLPTSGRNYYSLVDLAPGANAGPANGISSGLRADDRRPASEVVINGQSDTRNNNLLDGMDNNGRTSNNAIIRPSIDAIQEVSVATNSYPASMGNTAGAAVNVLTKSGTNAYHGGAYEYFRNDLFDAKDYFATPANGIMQKPERRQNQFGGSLGGAIKRDKTFFFADVEDLRKVFGQITPATVPTLAEWNSLHAGNADFSDNGGYPAPPLGIDPAGLAVAKLYPKPTNCNSVATCAVAPTVNNYTALTNYTQFDLTADGRVDHHFTANDAMFARFSYNNVTTTVPGLFPAVTEAGITIQPGGNVYGWEGTAYEISNNGMLSYTHIFTPNLVMEAKGGFTRWQHIYATLNQGTNASAALGLINSDDSSYRTTTGLAALYPAGYASLGDSNWQPNWNYYNNYAETGTLTYTRGKHSFKAGGSLVRRQLNGWQGGAYPLGWYVFLYNSQAPFTSPNAVQDMVQGVALEALRANNITANQFRSWEPSGFIQDDWRITPRITLNLGLRYDIWTPVKDAKNDEANYITSNLSSPSGATFTQLLASSNPTVGVNTDYKDFAPRFGFAATVRNGTVVRGAFGISYFPVNTLNTFGIDNPPYSTASTSTVVGLDQSNGLYYASCGAPYYTCGLYGGDAIPLPNNLALNTNINVVPPTFNNSYAEEYNLNVQQEFSHNVLTVAYVGELGKKLIVQPNIDLPNPSTAASPVPYYTGASAAGLSTIQEYLAAGTSSFQALEANFVRHMSRGLSVNANYTWAHMVDDVPGNSYSTAPWGLLPRAWATYDRGNSDTDVRHRFAMSATYTFPFTKSYTGAKGIALKGWQMNGVGYWQTGQPYTVIDIEEARINIGPTMTCHCDRPSLVPGQNWRVSNPSIKKAFNTAAFAPQTFGTAGNEPRNLLYGLHQRRVDLSIFRDFKLREGVKFQFRAEAYDITNTPNFDFPQTDIGNGAFGTIDDTSPSVDATARIFQFAGKLSF